MSSIRHPGEPGEPGVRRREVEEVEVYGNLMQLSDLRWLVERCDAKQMPDNAKVEVRGSGSQQRDPDIAYIKVKG